MNLRPPGPQPERSRRTRCDSALQSDSSCSELGSVALNLDPGLDPVMRRRPAANKASAAARALIVPLTIMRCRGVPVWRALPIGPLMARAEAHLTRA